MGPKNGIKKSSMFDNYSGERYKKEYSKKKMRLPDLPVGKWAPHSAECVCRDIRDFIHSDPGHELFAKVKFCFLLFPRFLDDLKT